jgi:uncharacterized protein
VTFVSDTSPITNLAAIAQLDLLNQLYGTLWIPEAVYEELTRFDVPGSVEVQTLGWIETIAVVNTELVVQLESELDPGEAAAIALAVERQATLLMLDERRVKLPRSKDAGISEESIKELS